MKDWDFNDRRAELFGREPDVAHLLGRCKHSGLTVVPGRPRLGKSWLLEETARRLMELEFLVGYAESSAEQPDLLLRAVADAYARWLAQSSMGDQARSLYDRHKDGLVGQVGNRVGQLLKAASKAGGVGWKVAGEMAAKALSGLADLDTDLKSAGLKLPSLNYDEARDLTDHLARISGKGVVLILDAWEKTPASAREIGILDTFLDHLEDWPSTHLFLSYRTEGEGDERLQRLRQLITGSPDAEEYPLPIMHLGQEDERQRLLNYVHQSVGGAASEVSDEDMEAWIAGFPGVVEWWTRQAVKEELTSSDDLDRAASDAQAGRYQPEFDRLLAPLETEPKLLQVAARLALLPQMSSESWWEALQDTIAEEDLQQSVAHLKVRGVLDTRQARFPSYGHSTRHEAARRWFLEGRLLPLICIEMDHVARSLAAQFREAEPTNNPFIRALVGLRPALQYYDDSNITKGLIEVATCLVLGSVVSKEVLETGFLQAQEDSSLAPFWATALLNNLFRSQEDDRDGRQQVLDQLRQLARRFPDDTAVRELLAMGLCGNLIEHSQDYDKEGRQQVIDELRQLAQRFPDDTNVREGLARGLFENLNICEQEGDQDGRELMRKELQQLAHRFPNHTAVQESLARGLLINLLGRGQEDDRDGREQMFEELRQLAHRFPNQTTIGEQLAKGLLFNLTFHSQVDDPDGRAQLLDEIRQLAHRFPHNTTIREILAIGLFNDIYHRSQEDDRDGPEQRLDDLRQLAHRFPDDNAVREQLAKGLSTSLYNRSQKDDRDGLDQILNELRQLAHRFPDDNAVRESLAMGLFNNFNDRSQEGDSVGAEQMLKELQQLPHLFPDETVVREALAKGLLNNLIDRSRVDDRDGREQMFDDLSHLARRFPNDQTVGEQLARGLYNNLYHRGQEDDRDGREQMLEELRQLARRFPDNYAVREQLARGLFGNLHYRIEEGNRNGGEQMLSNLRRLAQRFPEDDWGREILEMAQKLRSGLPTPEPR